MPRLTRIILQLLLCLPLLVFAPAAWMGLFTFLAALTAVDTAGLQRSVFFAGTGAALAALLASILLPHAWIVAARWRKIVVVVGLELGWALMLTFLFYNPPKPASPAEVALSIWMLGGPAIVATWNFVLLIRPPAKQPDH